MTGIDMASFEPELELSELDGGDGFQISGVEAGEALLHKSMV